MNIAWRRRRAAFQYPIPPAPRTAVLVDWFDASPMRGNPVQTFAGGWTSQTAAFAPAALAGTREQILRLTENTPRLTHAIIVLARPGDPLVTGEERDRLWRAFGVPLFEQIIDADGRLLAAECEAHDGLHLLVAGRTWDAYVTETAPCGCGQTSPRLRGQVVAERAPLAAHAG
jgi:hypothetical protein